MNAPPRRQPPQSGGLPRRTFCFTFFDLRAPEKISIKEKQNVLLGSALRAGGVIRSDGSAFPP